MPSLARFLGATDLNLTPRWRYRFVGFGTAAATVPGVVYIDVGGTLAAGVIDHHQGGWRCASEAVLRNREQIYNHLLGPWLVTPDALRAQTIWQPTIVTHHGPDWDALVAIHLARELIETGDFPPYADALVEYAAEVDQGRIRFDAAEPASLYSPHLGYLAVQHLCRDGVPIDSEEMLNRGLELLEMTVATVMPSLSKAASAADFRSAAARAWAEHPSFADARQLLDEDASRFERDLPAAHRLDVLLPSASTSEPVRAAAFVLDVPPQSTLDKYWFRDAGAAFLIIPRGACRGSGSDATYERVILSIDPNAEGIASDGTRHRLSLSGLGYALEAAETAWREASGGDHRNGVPRFPGYCKNHDPWYDGRGHEFGIVDSPRSGTVLPFRTIVEIATSGRFWEVPVVHGAVTLVRSVPLSTAGDRPFAQTGPFDGMSSAANEFGRDSRETAPETESLDQFFTRRRWFRRLPQVDARCLEITKIEATSPGATLELLVAHRREHAGFDRNVYSLARVRAAEHVTSPARVRALLDELGGGEVEERSWPERLDMALFGGRTLVLYEHARAVPEDSDVQMLLYCAFVCEMLAEYELRISRIIRDDRTIDSDEANELRESFIQFQSRFYCLDPASTLVGRYLHSEISRSLKLAERYEEVQRELDRLAQIEAAIAAKARVRADAFVGMFMFGINLLVVLQTVLAFAVWLGTARQGWWIWSGSILVLGVSAYLLLVRGATRHIRRLSERPERRTGTLTPPRPPKLAPDALR